MAKPSYFLSTTSGPLMLFPLLVCRGLVIHVIPVKVWHWHCLIGLERQARGLKN